MSKKPNEPTINGLCGRLDRYLEDLQAMFKRLADFEERFKKFEQDYDTEANKNLKPGDKVECEIEGSIRTVEGTIVTGPRCGQYLVDHGGGWKLYYDYKIKKAKA